MIAIDETGDKVLLGRSVRKPCPDKTLTSNTPPTPEPFPLELLLGPGWLHRTRGVPRKCGCKRNVGRGWSSRLECHIPFRPTMGMILHSLTPQRNILICLLLAIPRKSDARFLRPR